MFVDDFVELNFSDRNFLNLRPNPDTNVAFHGVCPEALTIPQRRTRQANASGCTQRYSHALRLARRAWPRPQTPKAVTMQQDRRRACL
jgi:hypothetical protein